MNHQTDFPKLQDLPLDRRHPEGTAWTLFDGTEDSRQLGHLCLLTPERVANAAKEVQTGIRVSLNLPINKLQFPTDGRRPLQHTVIELVDGRVNDDELHFNTQCGSQWDGFRHFSTEDGHFYSGLTQAQIHQPGSTDLGIHYWAKKGIVGRGVLVDFWKWSNTKGRPYNPLDPHSISLTELLQCMKDQQVETQTGDIFCVRYGFLEAYEALSEEQKQEFAKRPSMWAGLEQTQEVLEWFWERRFAAVVADNPSFEGFPSRASFLLHEYFLPRWGLPIGELFALDDLAKELAKLGRHSFFFCSEPLCVIGGVASPPQALAIM